jgi:NADH-quinone oxidoreductase subunit N
MMEIKFASSELLFLMPEIVLSLFGLFLLLLEAVRKAESKVFLGVLTIIGALSSLAFSLFLFGSNLDVMFGLVSLDGLSGLFRILFPVILILVCLASLRYMEREGVRFGEYYPLLSFATVGMMVMVSSNNFITLFMGLEVMSISIYVLCGLFREDSRSVEASLKYFLLGAFSTAFLLYGIALLYGLTGSLDVRELVRYLSKNTASSLFMVGVALLLVGFAFKTALVPFHMWTPDVYEGAPTSVTAFMATGVKAASFVAFLRVFYTAFIPIVKEWSGILWLVCVLTMSFANLTALVQNNIKRMLAYSSIAHAGYMLCAFVTGDRPLSASILYYLIAYTFMNIGAFACVILLGRKGQENLEIESYAGLSGRHPFVALSMTIFLLSLTGVPPLAGFMGKFYVFSTAVKAGYVWLAVIGVLNSVVAAYYYLRVVMYMYFREPVKELGAIDICPSYVFVILLCIFFLLYMGIFPRPFMLLAEAAVRVFP